MSTAIKALNDSISLVQKMIDKHAGYPGCVTDCAMYREAVTLQGLLIDAKKHRGNDQFLVASVFSIVSALVREGTQLVTRGRLYPVASAKFLLANLVAGEFKSLNNMVLAIYLSTAKM